MAAGAPAASRGKGSGRRRLFRQDSSCIALLPTLLLALHSAVICTSLLRHPSPRPLSCTAWLCPLAPPSSSAALAAIIVPIVLTEHSHAGGRPPHHAAALAGRPAARCAANPGLLAHPGLGMNASMLLCSVQLARRLLLSRACCRRRHPARHPPRGSPRPRSASPSSPGMATLSHEVVTGLDISKKGQDPPLRPDAELPQWLWELAEPAKTLNELRRTKEEELTFEQVSAGWQGGVCLLESRLGAAFCARPASTRDCGLERWGAAASPKAQPARPHSPFPCLLPPGLPAARAVCEA